MFTGTGDALTWLSRIYRLDRTRDQDVSLYLGVEKAGMVVQLQSWFGDLGVPVLALGGYSSQTYTDDVAAHAGDRERPAVLLYAGDFDPSGEDIDRDFIERSACWDKVIRVALSTDQVRDYRLPANTGKVTDSRAAGFIERHGVADAGRARRPGPGRPSGALPVGGRPLLGHVRIRAGARRRGLRPGAPPRSRRGGAMSRPVGPVVAALGRAVLDGTMTKKEAVAFALTAQRLADPAYVDRVINAYARHLLAEYLGEAEVIPLARPEAGRPQAS